MKRAKITRRMFYKKIIKVSDGIRAFVASFPVCRNRLIMVDNLCKSLLDRREPLASVDTEIPT